MSFEFFALLFLGPKFPLQKLKILTYTADCFLSLHRAFAIFFKSSY